ncbi:FGGY family pentulose kinase [Rhizobium sp. C4]|uniref:FGGY family pentulose kinase n=1 Tax=Rhizobium sp. C4 TaxID=1349800 RepID=UPI001E4C7D66|nr:FGGY family pentulose kinase [Rhizobium sp. C4]MCD2174319.1 FGGY family pentulose kinase [Rhizobium sp. C4]
MGEFIVAVDVGTASARAGVFTLDGRQLARAVSPMRVLQPQAGHYEQVSDEIWQAVIESVRAALRDAQVDAAEVAAIGFDATCSLVVRDGEGRPLPVTAAGATQADTLLWMDHRANSEAEECSIDDPLVTRFGGKLSPEMQVPKLLWLKRHLPETWAGMGLAFDLCDYLTWCATGRETDGGSRSHSPLSSKWAYEPAAPGARPDDFYARIGLSDLAERAGLPATSRPSSEAAGRLCAAAQQELGLGPDCVVASGLIDGYAGAIGVFCGADLATLERKAALVAGTSTCLVTFSEREFNHPGCWGGFRDAGLPGHWLMEAGQSASGALLDHVIRTHPAGGAPTREKHLQLLDHIAARVAEMGVGYGLPLALLPDFHGSRSPVPDPTQTGLITGLTLDTSFDGLAQLYWRACIALACNIRQILEHLPQGGEIESLFMTGGFAGHPLIPQLYADVTGRALRLHEGRDAVLLGTAVNAGLAAGLYLDFADASGRMKPATKTVEPRPEAARAHERDYAVFLTLQRQRAELAALLRPRG